MKKYMLGLAALLLMMVMTSAALAGAGDTVERNCPTCGETRTGTVAEVTSWNASRHQFTFQCGTCQNTSECDEAHYGGGSNCSYSGMCSLCGTYYRDWDNHNWSNWKPTEDGKQHYRTCSNDFYNPCTEYADHTVSDPQKLCTELQPCTDCHANFYSDNHNWGDCKPTEDSKQHYYTCTRDSSHTMLADHASTPQATCVIEQTCAACKASYTDPTNHQGTTYIRYEPEQPHAHLLVTACSDCDGTITFEYQNHPTDSFLTAYADQDDETHLIYYRCRLCLGYVPISTTTEPHTFSEATCVEAPTCVCGRVSGDKDPDNHDFGAWTRLDDRQHTRTCENEECGKVETGYHTGGTATATEQAVCELCYSPYGGLLPVVTAPAQDRTVTVYEGERATMTITAEHAAHYQWQTSTDGGATWADCGTDSPAFTTAPAKLADDGTRYRCTAIGSGALEQPGQEIPPEGAQMSLRSMSRATDDAASAPLTAESPVFTLRVVRKEALPQTGDSAHPGLWLALGIISVAALAVLLLRGRKRRAQ